MREVLFKSLSGDIEESVDFEESAELQEEVKVAEEVLPVEVLERLPEQPQKKGKRVQFANLTKDNCSASRGSVDSEGFTVVQRKRNWRPRNQKVHSKQQ